MDRKCPLSFEAVVSTRSWGRGFGPGAEEPQSTLLRREQGRLFSSGRWERGMPWPPLGASYGHGTSFIHLEKPQEQNIESKPSAGGLGPFTYSVKACREAKEGPQRGPWVPGHFNYGRKVFSLSWAVGPTGLIR